jgi:protein farnesyltransferase subunit beta
MLDDGVTTTTSLAQQELAGGVLQLYRDYADEGFAEDDPALILTRKQHGKYLASGLGELPSGFIALDASRTWICYWVTHALALLGAPLPKELPAARVAAFLASCQHPDGGFGGGPYQLAHLAPTYAGGSLLFLLFFLLPFACTIWH